MKNTLLLTFLLIGSIATQAQFNSGSTGADGALNTDSTAISGCTVVGSFCYVQLPESGILNYTTVTVRDKVLRFRRNSRNTPVVLLAQGAVLIQGSVDVEAPFLSPAHSTQPGPGGFAGGQINMPGFGPGAGTLPGQSGRWLGPLNLQPIVGGSGGFGGNNDGIDGGGGGGAIVIAASSSISVEAPGGLISANGVNSLAGINLGGTNGSGGAIRLVADTVNVSGVLSAISPVNGSSNCSNGLCGVIRIEANHLTFTGTSLPLAVQAPINAVIVSPTPPRLSITTVGGFSVPANAGSRLNLIDVLLPNQLPDPVDVTISAQNIPVGTQVQIGFVSGSPNGTSTPCNLAGTLATSSCTATVSNLNRTGGTYLLATAVFDPPASIARFNPKGRNQVTKISLETRFGGKATYKFFRADGTEIGIGLLDPNLLREFGI